MLTVQHDSLRWSKEISSKSVTATETNMRLTASCLTLLLLLLVLLARPAIGQERRPQSNRVRAKQPAAANIPTFETLIGDDCYKFYGEARNVGQLIRSESAHQLLEPVLKFAGPPLEFKSIVKFLDAHSEEVINSRLLVATWPNARNVPDYVIAIDFSATEEATKFSTTLDPFLNKVLPPTEETPDGKSESGPTKPAPKSLKPSFYLAQYGSMLVLTPTKLTASGLRTNGKLLVENPNFRTAHNRFTAESLFLFIDFSAIEKEEEETRKRYEAEAKKRQEEQERNPPPAEAAEQAEEKQPLEIPQPETPEPQEAPKEEPTPAPISIAMQGITNSIFSGTQEKWPDAIGVAISFEGDSFDARVLLINSLGEKSIPIPFLPVIIPTPGIVPESPNILPADTELFISLALDLQQIYTRIVTASPNQASFSPMRKLNDNETPFTALEAQLKLKVKDDILPLLGSEVAFSLPMRTLDFLPSPGGRPQAQPQSSPDGTNANQPFVPGPIVLLSVRDREGVKAILPKIVEAIGFKGASAFAQTETREDTEIVSYANAFAYAFIGNFLVLSSDAPTIRHVVDKYLNHETLAVDNQFKNYTRWQPRQLQGQVYISPALMASYRTWAQQPNTVITDQTREFLSRLSVIAEPVTYSLSNDGLGALHELHVPKNLVLMAVAGIAGEANPPPLLSNERNAINVLYTIFSAELRFHADKGSGSFTSLEELMDQNLVNKELLEKSGYKIDVIASGTKFQATAVPLEYGKTGKRSFFINESGIVRGGDHGGGAASVEDDPIN